MATRGSACALVNIGAAASSAHCLRSGDGETWFKAYTMRAPKLVYQIDIFFSLPVNEPLEETESDALLFQEDKLSLGDF